MKSRKHLFREERLREIIDVVEYSGKAAVEELASRFGVTGETIRRDLEALQKERKLIKVHGGAMRNICSGFEPSFIERNTRNIREKIAAGRTASALVVDNDIIFIDVGTTTMQMIPYLAGKNNLTVVTNSISAVSVLIQMDQENCPGWSIYLTGGVVRRDIMAAVGPLAANVYSEIYVDKAFIGAAGISIEHGITDFNIEAVEISGKMIENSREVYVLADNSKINVRGFYRVAAINDLDGIVSNTECPESWEEALEEYSVKWYPGWVS